MTQNPALIDQAAVKVELSRVRRCRKALKEGDTFVATMTEKEQKLWYLLVEYRDTAIEMIDRVEDLLDLHLSDYKKNPCKEGCGEEFVKKLDIALHKAKEPFSTYKDVEGYFFGMVKLAHPVLLSKEFFGVREGEKLVWRTDNLYNDVENLYSNIYRKIFEYLGEEVVRVFAIPLS